MAYIVAMHIDIVPNRNSKPAVLLRESYREGKKVRKRTIANLSKLPKDQVVFGTSVLLENVDTGDEIEYQLVGPDESDIDKGKISVSSPIGQAILGKKPGDEISVQAPGGKRNYELVDIL